MSERPPSPQKPAHSPLLSHYQNRTAGRPPGGIHESLVSGGFSRAIPEDDAEGPPTPNDRDNAMGAKTCHRVKPISILHHMPYVASVRKTLLQPLETENLSLQSQFPISARVCVHKDEHSKVQLERGRVKMKESWRSREITTRPIAIRTATAPEAKRVSAPVAVS